MNKDVLIKKNFPKEHVQRSIKITSSTINYPLYVKNLGYLNDKKFTVGSLAEPDDVLILYSLSGVAEFFRAKNLSYITENDVVTASCSVPVKFNKVSSDKWEFIYIIIGGSHAKYFYNLVRSKNNIIRCSLLSGIIDDMLELFSIDYDDSIHSCINSSYFLYRLFRDLYEITFAVINTKSILPVKDTHVNIAIKYIQKNYKKDISVDTVCNEVGFSKYYFCKIFKDQTGLTIHRYINEYRIIKAKDLLTYSKLSINTVASAVGYKNTLTFIRCFKHSTDMTPSEYRSNF